MVASAAAPQLKSVFCCIRSANLRSRMLWIGLYTTAPPGRTDSGSCAASITLDTQSKIAEAIIRMVGTPSGWVEKAPGGGRRLTALERLVGDGQRVALLVAHTSSHVDAQVAAAAVHRTAQGCSVGYRVGPAGLSQHLIRVGVAQIIRAAFAPAFRFCVLGFGRLAARFVIRRRVGFLERSVERFFERGIARFVVRGFTGFVVRDIERLVERGFARPVERGFARFVVCFVY